MIFMVQRLGRNDCGIFLFNTFDGMAEPAAADRSFMNQSARDLPDRGDKDTSLIWAKSGRDQVEALLAGTGYPK